MALPYKSRQWALRRLKFTLMVVLCCGAAATAQTVVVQFLNGANSKPIGEDKRVHVVFSNGTGRTLLSLHTDAQGQVTFEAAGAKTFQVAAVGYDICTAHPAESLQQDYSVDEVVQDGAVTDNDCSPRDQHPVPGKLLYFVKHAKHLKGTQE